MGDFVQRSEDQWSQIGRILSKPSFEHGYWGTIINQRMEDLFETLDWESLHGRSDVNLESTVRIIAKDKFLGAYDEATSQA